MTSSDLTTPTPTHPTSESTAAPSSTNSEHPDFSHGATCATRTGGECNCLASLIPTDDHGVQTGPPASDYEFGRAAVTFLAIEAIYACASVSQRLVELLTRGIVDDGDGQGGLNNWELLAIEYDKFQAAIEYMAENAEQDMGVPWFPTERARQLVHKGILRQRYQESSGRGLLRLPVVVVKNPIGEQPPAP